MGEWINHFNFTGFRNNLRHAVWCRSAGTTTKKTHTATRFSFESIVYHCQSMPDAAFGAHVCRCDWRRAEDYRGIGLLYC